MRPNRQPEWEQHAPAEEDAPRTTLTDHQRTRLTRASGDLDEARRTDLAQLDAAGLTLLVERLRGSLDDAVQLLREVAD